MRLSGQLNGTVLHWKRAHAETHGRLLHMSVWRLLAHLDWRVMVHRLLGLSRLLGWLASELLIDRLTSLAVEADRRRLRWLLTVESRRLEGLGLDSIVERGIKRR